MESCDLFSSTVPWQTPYTEVVLFKGCHGPVGTIELVLYREVKCIVSLFRVSFKGDPAVYNHVVYETWPAGMNCGCVLGLL